MRKQKSHHPFKALKSFRYAFWGLGHALKNELNFRIEVGIVFFTSICGFYFNITKTDWLILIIMMGFLLASEVLNTLIEEFIDFLVEEHHESAKIIKDLSAAFVFIYAITYSVVFSLVFYEYIL